MWEAIISNTWVQHAFLFLVVVPAIWYTLLGIVYGLFVLYCKLDDD